MPIAAHFESTGGSANATRAERRRLHLETQGSLASGVETSVLIHNFSETGLLLETGEDLEIGDTLDVSLPEAGVTRARVVWASGRLYGCAFKEPLSAATLSAAQLRSSLQLGGAMVPPEPRPASSIHAIGGETLGERIQRLRKLRGFTQGELAQRLGVSKPTVWAWEQGRARPIEDRLAAIADVLGVSAEDLRPDRIVPGLTDLVARCREQIAMAVETTPDKIRIMIDL